MTVTFYRPEAPAAKVVKAWCPPVHSVALLQVHGVTAGFELLPSARGVLARIMFEVPENHFVHLLERTVELAGPAGESATGTLRGSRWASAGRTETVPLDAPLRGSTGKKALGEPTRYGRTQHAYYFLEAHVAAAQSERLRLKPPRILINGAPAEVPEIGFSRTTESYIGALNC